MDRRLLLCLHRRSCFIARRSTIRTIRIARELLQPPQPLLPPPPHPLLQRRHRPVRSLSSVPRTPICLRHWAPTCRQASASPHSPPLTFPRLRPRRSRQSHRAQLNRCAFLFLMLPSLALLLHHNHPHTSVLRRRRQSCCRSQEKSQSDAAASLQMPLRRLRPRQALQTPPDLRPLPTQPA